MDVRTLESLTKARRERQAIVVVTDLSDGCAQAFRQGDKVPSEWHTVVSRAIASGRAGLMVLEERQFFINVYLPPPRLVVIGAVHISQTLAKIAPFAGFDVAVVDPRSAFATEDRFQGVELIADWPEVFLRTRPFDRYTAVAALTHDPKIDDLPIRMALEAGCFYVGALGSRRTHASRISRLFSAGVSEETIGRIRAPIGLDIAAVAPGEIAVAILAEIVGDLRRHSDLGTQDASR